MHKKIDIEGEFDVLKGGVVTLKDVNLLFI
jgi:hypothetical protein